MHAQPDHQPERRVFDRDRAAGAKGDQLRPSAGAGDPERVAEFGGAAWSVLAEVVDDRRR